MSAPFIFIPVGNRFEKILLSALLYIKTTDGQTEVVTTKGRYLVNADLAQFEKTLSRQQFCRVHARYMVSLDRIVHFDRRTVQLPGILLPLSRAYRRQLKNSIHIVEECKGPTLVIDQKGKLRTLHV